MLDPQLDEITRERARKAGVDWRNAWAGLDEASGACRAWPREAATALGVGFQHPAAVLEPCTALEPVRAQPAHASEMISEVRAGERLTGIVRRGAWWLVAGEDGYVGWVHEWVLREGEGSSEPPLYHYGRPLGTLWLSDNHAATPLVLGAPLWPVDGPLPERGGYRLLRTATGEEGWIAGDEIMAAEREVSVRDALNFARALVGTPYRWGGRSPLGFDCSGFVQYVATLCGAALPRDASQQAAHGDAVGTDPPAWQPGDLLFFGEPADHVALFDGKGGILHCQGRVRHERVDRRPDLMARLSGVRRWWGRRDLAGAWAPRLSGR